MSYNLEMLYQNKICELDELETNYEVIFSSPFNSYIIYEYSDDDDLDLAIINTISKRAKTDHDSFNGYITYIFRWGDHIFVDAMNDQGVCDTILKLPIDDKMESSDISSQLSKWTVKRMNEIQEKNLWIIGKDLISGFKYDSNDTVSRSEELYQSSLAVRYTSSVKQITDIEGIIDKGIRAFCNHYSVGYTNRCVYVYIKRKSSYPMLSGCICDNLGNYRRIQINFKNINRKRAVKFITKELVRQYCGITTEWGINEQDS